MVVIMAAHVAVLAVVGLLISHCLGIPVETAFRDVSVVYVYSYRHLLEKRPNYTYVLSCCAPK